MNTPSKTVLVTGSAGRIGRTAVRELKSRGHTVRGFDRAPTRGADESIVGEITDGDALCRAATGADAVIHLAATPDDDDFMTKLLPNNVVGVYQVMEAARLAGVKRILLASSGQVVWWQRFRGPYPIHPDTTPTPRGWYAATKLFLEAAGRVYAESHGMSVVAARFGWCPRTPEHAEELAQSGWGPDMYLSPGDAGRFCACAVETTADFQFAVVFAYSLPVRSHTFDMMPAKALLGYEPHDTWPVGIEDYG